MKRQSFVLSAIILTMGGFFAKAIGVLYKIPLTNILGSSGMGLYYLVFPVYSLAITLCSSGVAVALTLEVAKCRKIRHRYNEQKLLRVALILSFSLSLLLTLIILLIAKPMSILQGNSNAHIGYIAIAPAIILSCLIATLRGYFQGIENMIPTTISLIIEQVVKLSIGLILAHKLCVYGINYAVLGAILGVTFSEIVALVIIAINFLIYKGQLHYNYRNLAYKPKRFVPNIKKLKSKHCVIWGYNSKGIKYLKINSNTKRYSTKDALTKLIKVSLPSTLSSLVLPITILLDSLMIINILTASGYSSHIATILYGLSSGVVQSLLSVPIIIITAISTSLVPSLSGLVAQNDTNEIKHRIAFFIKITWVLSIVIFILVFVFAEDILLFLYGDGLTNNVINEFELATKILKFSSVSIIYYAFLHTFTSILQAIGHSHLPFLTMLICLFFRVGLVYALTSSSYVNIFGSIIANVVFLAITDMVLAYFIKTRIDIEYNLIRHLIKPVVIGVILFVIAEILRWCLRGVVHYFWSMIIVGIVVLLAYIFAILYGKVFNKKEKKYLMIFKNRRKKSKKL